MSVHLAKMRESRDWARFSAHDPTLPPSATKTWDQVREVFITKGHLPPSEFVAIEERLDGDVLRDWNRWQRAVATLIDVERESYQLTML